MKHQRSGYNLFFIFFLFYILSCMQWIKKKLFYLILFVKYIKRPDNNVLSYIIRLCCDNISRRPDKVLVYVPVVIITKEKFIIHHTKSNTKFLFNLFFYEYYFWFTYLVCENEKVHMIKWILFFSLHNIHLSITVTYAIWFILTWGF